MTKNGLNRFLDTFSVTNAPSLGDRDNLDSHREVDRIVQRQSTVSSESSDMADEKSLLKKSAKSSQAKPRESSKTPNSELKKSRSLVDTIGGAVKRLNNTSKYETVCVTEKSAQEKETNENKSKPSQETEWKDEFMDTLDKLGKKLSNLGLGFRKGKNGDESGPDGHARGPRSPKTSVNSAQDGTNIDHKVSSATFVHDQKRNSRKVGTSALNGMKDNSEPEAKHMNVSWIRRNAPRESLVNYIESKDSNQSNTKSTSQESERRSAASEPPK